MVTSGTRIPIVYEGQRFASRTALAQYLAPRCGKTLSTLMTLLSRYAGDVERATAPHPSRKFRGGIPIVYEGQRFASRTALAKYLGPRCGKTTSTLMTLLSRRDGDVERVIAPHPPRKFRRRIPIVYEGQRFESRAALAKYLAPRCGKTAATLMALLSRRHGDVERVIAPKRSSVPSPLTFEGQTFPTRRALAIHIAPRLNRPVQSVERLLIYYRDDIATVLAARPYEPHPRRSRRGPSPSHGVTSQA